MRYWEVFIIGVGLAMDAFAVSIGKGLSLKRMRLRYALAAGLYFGGFQALMPLLGWFLGGTFTKYVEAVGHWIAFGLLAFVGGSMVREAITAMREKRRAALEMGAERTAAGQGAAFTGDALAQGAERITAGQGTAAAGDALDVGGKGALSAEDGSAKSQKTAGKADFGARTMLPLAVATSIDAFAVGVSFSFFPINIWLSVAIIGFVTFVIAAFGVRIGMLFGERWSEKAELAGGILLILIGLGICIRGIL